VSGGYIAPFGFDTRVKSSAQRLELHPHTVTKRAEITPVRGENQKMLLQLLLAAKKKTRKKKILSPLGKKNSTRPAVSRSLKIIKEKREKN
jgi:hypothetical protein